MKKFGIKWCMCLLPLFAFVQTKAKDTEKIYMFAVSESFKDTIVYVTEIQSPENASLQKRTRFLLGRAAYGQQLKEYLTRQMGQSNRMVALFFSKKKGRIEKRYQKICNRFLADKTKHLEKITKEDFLFKGIEPIFDNNQASQKPAGESEK